MIGNILIVDDEPAALKLLKDILTADDHVVRPFNNGELALRSIMVEAPELILLDIRMQGMSGFEVCRRIKQDERLKDIPVIFIRAASDMDEKVRAFLGGGVDYITKPFQKEEVIARVKTHIALSHTIQRMKSIAESLRMSEESLKMAQALAHLGHWEWDIKSGRFICFEEMCRILGVDPHGLMANQAAFLQTVRPDDRERVANHLSSVQAGNSFDIEYRIILKSGKVRVVHGKGEVFSSVDSRLTKIIGTIQDIQERDSAKILVFIQDITERKELQSKLEEQANTDVLTGCDSRRYFLAHAAQEFIRLRHYGGEMSMLMLDLDYFKGVNDTYGHQVGDAVLKKTGTGLPGTHARGRCNGPARRRGVRHHAAGNRGRQGFRNRRALVSGCRCRGNSH
ncbi:response regulator [Candidatus Methylospira mobilis]|uniref:diguanylate cyclase n=1 Tax=Candidatus Methylospira mobilis TaxID=1808979 RepID=A0A5Q0BJ77_9GAMM|nr:response regulator [Candidatus Methylospira mobilis]QFY43863.1 response regulator [Candidatus Methylospira mobilis]